MRRKDAAKIIWRYDISPPFIVENKMRTIRYERRNFVA